jgi:RimJ/RimL family protein N-acetyltransferase
MSSKPGRNDPCPCGSGQKYKHCCLQEDQIIESAALAAAATGWVEKLDPPAKCEDVTIRLLSSELTEMVALQHVLECAPGYAERVTGAPPGAADAQSTFTALPVGKTYEDKFVFGIFAGNEMVGCIDLIRGYPTANAATLGLLLVAEQHQGMGIGRHAYALLERFASSWGNCNVIRLGIVMTNSEVLRFWRKLGFSETGETKPYNYGSVCSQTIIMEKPLQP